MQPVCSFLRCTAMFQHNMNGTCRYAEFLRNVIKREVNHRETYQFPLLGFKVAVDAGNGSGGFFATQVCSERRR